MSSPGSSPFDTPRRAAKDPVSTEPYDIAVIGGGPAGVAAALRARELGASVALVERGHPAAGVGGVGRAPRAPPGATPPWSRRTARAWRARVTGDGPVASGHETAALQARSACEQFGDQARA